MKSKMEFCENENELPATVKTPGSLSRFARAQVSTSKRRSRPMRPVTYVVPEQVRVVLLEAVVQYGDHHAQASNTFHPGRLHIHVQSLPTVLQHKRTVEENATECGNNQSVLWRMISAFLKYGKENRKITHGIFWSLYLNNITCKASHYSRFTGRITKITDVVRIINVQNVSCRICRNDTYLHAQVRSTKYLSGLLLA